MRLRILCAMPEGTFRRMFTPDLVADLEAMGSVTYCADGREMPDEEYAALWRSTDAAVTGWGVRAPTPGMVAGSPLRVIAHTAGSLRMFPRELLEQGIVITTARAGIARTVGEYCLLTAGLMLRRFHEILAERSDRRPINATLFDKTVGLVGYGCVGREFRKLLRPFDCRVLVYDPFLGESEAIPEEVELTELQDVLAASRVVSLHAPDIPETRGMIGSAQLAALQDGAVFINSARGRLVDTSALTDALASGRFSAALDVTDPEPLPPDHPLRSMPNVVLTPHVAGPTEDDLPRMTRMALDDLAAVLRGDLPRYPMTLEGYDRMSF